jgi:predicted MFS family arabinose efflux permease
MVVAVVVVVVESTGSAGWLAAANSLRLAMYVLLSPVGGVIVDRMELRRLVMVLNAGQAVVYGTCAALLAAGGGAAAVMVATTVAAAFAVVLDGARQAIVPAVVDVDDLAGANAVLGGGAQVAYLAAPAAAAAALALRGPSFTFGMIACLAAAAAASASRIGRLPVADTTGLTPTTGGLEPSDTSERSVWAEVGAGARLVRRRPVLRSMVIVSMAMWTVFGADRVVQVFVARDALGLDADAVGVMAAVAGVGGLLVIPLVRRLATSASAGVALACSGLAVGVPFALLGQVDDVALAVSALLLAGAGRMVYDVCFSTVLQRSTPTGAIGRVNGVHDSVTSIADVAGAVLVTVLLATTTLGTAMAVVGTLGVVVGLANLPTFRADVTAQRLRRTRLAPTVDAIAAFEIFDGLGIGALERIAETARRRFVEAGEVMVREGEPADRLFLVVTGAFSAHSVADGHLSTMVPGGWFGEIGVLRASPRTATVVASTPGDVWEIDGAAFVAAVVAPHRGRISLDRTMSVRLARTTHSH